jgi:hypothetical protein
MKIQITKIQEPDLEFGSQVHQPFVKDALLTGCGPFESSFYNGVKRINLGVVSLRAETEEILDWVESLHDSLVFNETNAFRFREFLGAEKTLRCKFLVNDRHVKEIDEGKYRETQARYGRERFDALLTLYSDQIQSLFADSGPDCILVQFPEEVASLRVANSRLTVSERSFLERVQEEDDAWQYELFEMTPDQKKLASELLPQADELLYRNFHRALKARCMNMHNSVPIQVIRRHTYVPDETSQSQSTIAWNIGLGLYYKAGNIPWRLHQISTDTCFVGISFHYLKRRAGDMVYASVAQAFSSSGEGFALKGSTIPKDQTRNKQPYLRPSQAEELMGDVLKHYQSKNGNLPSRVVIHKTSRYQPEEQEGIKSGLMDNVPSHEMIWLVPSGFRLLRRGMDPPDRGTLCTVEDKESFLFTTGYVPRWNEYPGPHIPSPLELGTSEPENLVETAKDILALTKMNWNSSEAVGRHPITLSFARRVGMIMTELDEDAQPNPLYRYYM